MARKLTTRFLSYNIVQFEKKTGKGVMDLLSIDEPTGEFEKVIDENGNETLVPITTLKLGKLIDLIRLGNPLDMNIADKEKAEMAAYERFDNYCLADDENGIITAYFDVLEEFDKDLKLLKNAGTSVKAMREEFLANRKKEVDKLMNTVKEKANEEIEAIRSAEVVEETAEVETE